MLPRDTALLSADDHIIEPPNLWTSRLPDRYRSEAPQIVRNNEGRDLWRFQDDLVHIEHGSIRALPGTEPHAWASFDEMRPGCYDPIERLKDMDLDEVRAELCFPNYARFAGHRFLPGDPELSLLCIRAYNDFLFEEWCAADPERLFGVALLPLWDVSAAVTELYRVADQGARAFAFSENPSVMGLPSLYREHWDPIWAAATDTGLVACAHIGSSSRLITSSQEAPLGTTVALVGVNSMIACVDFLFSGIFDRFPKLQLVLSEGGVGWLPYIVERAKKVFYDERVGGHGYVDVIPSRRPPEEVVRENLWFCLVAEKLGADLLDMLPTSNLLWEADYPHGDGLFPNNRKCLEESFMDIPSDVACSIAGGNLAKILRITETAT